MHCKTMSQETDQKRRKEIPIRTRTREGSPGVAAASFPLQHPVQGQHDLISRLDPKLTLPQLRGAWPIWRQGPRGTWTPARRLV